MIAVRTLGIDLASQARGTGACVIEWRAGEAEVGGVELGADDGRLLALATEVDAVGIDAPFGWPLPFVELMERHHRGEGGGPGWGTARRDELCFRRTDVAVRRTLGRWPLSVASDRIAIVAMRCAGLLERLGVEDRSGGGRVVETYPAVALHAWGFASRGYKRDDPAVLGALVEGLRSVCPWLSWAPGTAAACGRSDHAFDALVASLVVRAAALGLTEPPPAEDAAAARREGWIAVPLPGSLSCLVGPAAAGRDGEGG